MESRRLGYLSLQQLIDNHYYDKEEKSNKGT